MASETIQIKKLSEYTEVTFSGGKYPIEIEANKGISEHYNSLILSKSEAKALRDFLNEHDVC